MGQSALGRFWPGDSLVHRLDPRLKLAGGLGVVAVLFATDRAVPLALLAGLVVALAAASRVPVRALLAAPVWLLAVLLLSGLLLGFTTPGPTLARWGPLTLSATGLVLAAVVSARLAVLTVGVGVLTATTTPMGITDALSWLLAPLGAVGLPTAEFAMMMTIALRFVPTVFAEADQIARAQAARGADWTTGGPVRRARALLPLLVPLFVAALRRTEDLAVAMEARGYRGGRGRTRLHPLVWTRLDTVVSAACGLVLAAALAAQVMAR